MHAMILSLVLCGQAAPNQSAPPVAVVERLEATQSKLLAAIERLEQRLAALENANQNGVTEVDPEQADPERNDTKGGRWVYHPATGQPVFASTEMHSYTTPGGSKIIETLRINGKPVLGKTVVWGDQKPMALPFQQQEPERRERGRQVRAALER